MLNSAFKGQYEKYGFQEILLTTAPKADAPKSDEPPKNPIKEMAEFLIKSGMLSAKSPLEKLKADDNSANFMEKIYQTVIEYDPQIEAALKEGAPDVIIVDHFLVSPAFKKSGIPWLFLFRLVVWFISLSSMI